MAFCICASSSSLFSIFASTPAINPISTTTAPALCSLRIVLHFPRHSFLSLSSSRISKNPLRATPPPRYVYPDPIPEFAEHETRKFRAELLKKLSEEKETFGDDLNHVIEVCAEILSDFLHEEYGGPGTLLVEPFTDMFTALKERRLPGAPLAARVSLLWAQNYVDQDWQVWNSNLQR
ncbi:hypothetical protein HS088_TW22G00447 [Tripterygium wilfordii]|uniref:Protein PLASTID REDOX INSENSITIVE 2 n=2 Tax=Tripterygium wilfordii TaxID=458696 RepID=A0A7J7BYK3_TRIWF|nr:hypothetical protein HS088_TW22G00447 [Tripterygium wilfordii]